MRGWRPGFTLRGPYKHTLQALTLSTGVASLRRLRTHTALCPSKFTPSYVMSQQAIQSILLNGNMKRLSQRHTKSRQSIVIYLLREKLSSRNLRMETSGRRAKGAQIGASTCLQRFNQPLWLSAVLPRLTLQPLWYQTLLSRRTINARVESWYLGRTITASNEARGRLTSCLKSPRTKQSSPSFRKP